MRRVFHTRTAFDSATSFASARWQGSQPRERAAVSVARRPVLNAKKIALAKSLYKDQRNSPSEIAETLGVSRSTLYRYLSPAPIETPQVTVIASMATSL